MRGKLAADVFLEPYYTSKEDQIELNQALTFDRTMEPDRRNKILETAIRKRLCQDLEKFKSISALRELAETDSVFRMRLLPEVKEILGV